MKLKNILTMILAVTLIFSLFSVSTVFAADVDLMVSQVNANASNLYDGDEILISATVRNYSGSSSGQFEVGFYADGTLVETVISTQSIAAGTYKQITTTVPWKPFFGSHKLKAIVSPTSETDSYTENNIAVSRVMVLDEKNPNPKPQPQERKRVVGYIPNWSYGCYQTVDWSALTHLNIAFVNPDANGNLNHGFWEGDHVLTNIVNKAHENNVKVLISLGGAGGSANYPELTASDKVDGFCQKIITFMNNNNIDGVDIDVEGEVDNAFWNNYENFVSKLRVQCNNNNKLLTTAVGQWYAYKISDSTFQYFDFVNVMAYDGDKSQHSSYDLAQSMLNYFEGRGIAKDKLVLGVPFYGYTTDTGSYTAYKDIISQYPNNWTSDYAGNYAYNGTETMARKTKLGKEYGGIMIWELSQDVTGDKSLLKAIKDNI